MVIIPVDTGKSEFSSSQGGTMVFLRLYPHEGREWKDNIFP